MLEEIELKRPPARHLTHFDIKVFQPCIGKKFTNLNIHLPRENVDPASNSLP